MLSFFCIGNPQRSHNAETDMQGVGMIPDALRKLRVLIFPILGRADPGGAAEHFGIVIPRAAPNHTRKQFCGDIQRTHSSLFGKLFVVVGTVLIEHPFGDVPVNVVQAPGIGFFLADFVIGVVAVAVMPGIVI